jgi:hypothetical protein
METDRPARSRRPLRPPTRARRDNARAEAIERVARWKRGVGAGAVLALGVLIGVVGVAGTKGASGPGAHPSSGRSITRSGAGPGGVVGGDESDDPGGQADSDDQVAPGQVPDDGYFGGQSGGYGFGGAQGGQSQSHAQSYVS